MMSAATAAPTRNSRPSLTVTVARHGDATWTGLCDRRWIRNDGLVGTWRHVRRWEV